MANVPGGAAQYLTRFGEQSVTCSPYALSKLGVDRSRCFLKIEDYMILCVPFQFGFKKAVFLASLSKQELTFFQRYVNGIVGLSITFLPPGSKTPIKFFIRSTLTTIGPVKGRENVGLFALDYKTTPDELVIMLGSYMDDQDRIKVQFDDYGTTPVKMTPEAAKIMGYNMYSTITEPNTNPKRIQVFNLSTKMIEHLEAAGSALRPAGTSVAYQLYFKKYRVAAAGSVVSSGILPQNLVRTVSNLAFSPEIVEILDDYWYTTRANPANKTDM
jgi:hypothetical protein